jgi:hypothetical protein
MSTTYEAKPKQLKTSTCKCNGNCKCKTADYPVFYAQGSAQVQVVKKAGIDMKIDLDTQ